MPEVWATNDDLRAAQERYAARIPGFVMPAAYTVARKDGRNLTFGHINRPGAVRPLPAVVLASVCGYTATTSVIDLDHEELATAIGRLTPAEAATHIPHPNLWSWRNLLADASPSSHFLAIYVANTDDPPTDQNDVHFRRLLAD